ncbi:MAG: hypothetical protein ABFD98_15825 [Syntrophobacteraceae bacterium]|nr:hypothetical protein [Desulfobacteraceae bacterium]
MSNKEKRKPSPGTGQKKPEPQQKLVQLPFDTILKSICLKSNKGLLSEIIKRRNGANLVTLVLKENVQLAPDIVVPLFEVLKSIGKTDHIDLFLSTTGGATEVPWRIVSLVREFCTSYTAIIPFLAMSAGTHIALGADDLIMHELSTLGPVDPTTKHALLPREPETKKTIPVSVEDLKNCIKFISQQLSEETNYSPSDMANIVGQLFQHIEPLAIGAVERAYALSRLITKRVLETHLDPEDDKDKIERIVDRIGGEYFSHSFPITLRDVEHDLQLKVKRPDSDLFDAIWALHSHYKGCFGSRVNVNLTLTGNGDQKQVLFIVETLGYIDSVIQRRVLIQIREVKMEPGTDRAVEQPLLTAWVIPNPDELPTSDTRYIASHLPPPAQAK